MEAKWSSEKYVPTIEEYLHVASPSTAYPLFITIFFVRMGDFVTKEAFEWVLNEPNTIVNAASIIGKIMNDLVSHEVWIKDNFVFFFSFIDQKRCLCIRLIFLSIFSLSHPACIRQLQNISTMGVTLRENGEN